MTLGKIKGLVLNDVPTVYQVQDYLHHLTHYLILTTSHLVDEKMEDQEIKQLVRNPQQLVAENWGYEPNLSNSKTLYHYIQYFR